MKKVMIEMSKFVIYEINAYQENGFASTSKTVGFYHNKEEAKAKVEELNKIDKDWLYSLREVEVH